MPRRHMFMRRANLGMGARAVSGITFDRQRSPVHRRKHGETQHGPKSMPDADGSPSTNAQSMARLTRAGRVARSIAQIRR